MARFAMLYPLHPILHIHVAHVGLLLVRLPAPTIIGGLKNEVVENKHRKAKNLHTIQGAKQGGPFVDVRG